MHLLLHIFNLYWFISKCTGYPAFPRSHPLVEGAAPLFLLADEDHAATTGFLLLLGFPQFHLEQQKESPEHDDVIMASRNHWSVFETCHSIIFIILTSTSTPLSSITLMLPLERGMKDGEEGTPLSRDMLQAEIERERNRIHTEYWILMWNRTHYVVISNSIMLHWCHMTLRHWIFNLASSQKNKYKKYILNYKYQNKY